jgi:uncharacterized protein (TIGR01777 family)
MSARIVISGSSGLIGTELVRMLRDRGDDVVRLVRRPPARPDEVQWSPADGALDPHALAGADAVVALGGASVGRLPWTPRYRRELRSSRIDSTRTLVDALLKLGDNAPALVSASAVGYYGSAPGRELDENAPAGDTFLARLCVEWESQARRAESVTRVALLRTAPVIERHGVLAPLILMTRLGVAGPIGPGSQVWPWISLEDEARAIVHVLDARLDGPVNLTGPSRATADDVGRSLAQAMHRPFWLRAPEWAVKVALSTDATESLLTADADVRPRVLERSGFEFRHPTIGQAVEAALTRS